LHQKRLEADRRAYDFATGRDLGDENFSIVLKAVELFELRCCGYLEPFWSDMVMQGGCGWCADRVCERARRCKKKRCDLKRPGWNEAGIMRLF